MASGPTALPRYLATPVRDDLQRKMVFLGGPRQVGKTTLALGLLGARIRRHPGYLNWDDARVRPGLLRGNLPSGQKLVVLDEIHKFPRWRNLVKGFYDTEGDRVSILVTGLARLDHYRKGGDSLQGRYHHYRLHPFSLGELGGDGGGERPGSADAVRRLPGTTAGRKCSNLAPVAPGRALAGGVRGPARSRKCAGSRAS